MPDTTAPNKENATATTDVRQLPVRMPEDVYNALKGLAYFTRRSMNEIVVAAIADYLRHSSTDELNEIVERAREDYRQVLDKLADL